MSAAPLLLPAGDRGVLVELPGNASVRKLVAALPSAMGGLEEIVAGHETVLLVWEAGRRPPPDLATRLAELLGGPGSAAAAGSIDVPVIYEGPDLALVAAAAGMSPEEVVRRHLGARYEVGFLGFAPGFAYLLGGDPALRPPRRADPRTRIPAGSLAIAGEYSAVYPSASPGGWNLIGRALVAPFELDRDPPVLLRTGMHVRFVEGPGR